MFFSRLNGDKANCNKIICPIITIIVNFITNQNKKKKKNISHCLNVDFNFFFGKIKMNNCH